MCRGEGVLNEFEITKIYNNNFNNLRYFTLGVLFMDVFCLMGITIFLDLYLILAIPFLLILSIISIIVLVIKRNFNLRGFIPLIIIVSTVFIVLVNFCLAPGTILSHEISLYFFSKKLFNCPLPPDSELILKGSEHGNGSGSGNHWENLAYIAISSNSDIDEITGYYKSKLSNRTGGGNLYIYLFDKDERCPFKYQYILFRFTEDEKKQLIQAEGKKKAIYLVTVVEGCSPTCLSGH